MTLSVERGCPKIDGGNRKTKETAVPREKILFFDKNLKVSVFM